MKSVTINVELTAVVPDNWGEEDIELITLDLPIEKIGIFGSERTKASKTAKVTGYTTGGCHENK